jgi:hypothetical protein
MFLLEFLKKNKYDGINTTLKWLRFLFAWRRGDNGVMEFETSR